jgi:glucose/mannose-6-phosphate isomerase
MSVLDDPALRLARDPSGMLEVALALPTQIREAWGLGARASLPALPASPAHLVFCGMGGSAIGGDLLGGYLAPVCTLPVAVVRDYDVPAFVGPRSLVIVASYSGTTEETLAAASAAKRAGATLFVITSGGALAEAAGRAGVLVPGGLAPRAALGYLMIPALAALARWGLIGPCGEEVAQAARSLEDLSAELGPDVPTARNPAKALAEDLVGLVPAVYAASPQLEAAARRWKCQFNENSKTIATWNMFPELNHNETVGWGAPASIAERFSAVVLLDGTEPARLLRRIQLTCELALGPAAGVRQVRARGAGRLARLLSLVFWGDLVSIYLAYLRGVDPTPVEIIDKVKEALGRA